MRPSERPAKAIPPSTRPAGSPSPPEQPGWRRRRPGPRRRTARAAGPKGRLSAHTASGRPPDRLPRPGSPSTTTAPTSRTSPRSSGSRSRTVRNAHREDHIPGGSSGGTAAVVAAGPIARSVADVRLADGVCAPSGADRDMTADLAGLRLGVPAAHFYDDLDPDVATVTEHALSELAARGAVLVERDIPDVRRLNELVSFTVVLYEVGRELSAYLYQHAAPVALRELVGRVATAQVRETLESILDEDQVPAADYREALAVHRPALRTAYAGYFADHDVSAVLVPTTPLPARPHRPAGEDRTVELNGDDADTFRTYIRNTDPPSNAGLPCLSIPSGLSREACRSASNSSAPTRPTPGCWPSARRSSALPPLPRPAP
ncbi:amidase family protein [Actinomadura sp. 3N407]|uniref:amidase family protein n=1 Tax=Actinomadura sp. 3N407 TaxID=3457423 RepID=UPI003FCC92F9